MNQKEVNTRVFDALQGQGVGHLYPKRVSGGCEERQQTPFFKTAEDFHKYIKKVKKPDIQLVPFRDYTLIDIDMGDLSSEDRGKLETYLDKTNVSWARTLWYKTNNGRHYYFKYPKSDIIGERKALTRCLEFDILPGFNHIDVPWNGKCPPTSGRKFVAVNKPLAIDSLDALGLRVLVKPIHNLDHIIPTDDRETLSDAEEKALYKNIDKIKTKYPTAPVPGNGGSMKIVTGNRHSAILKLSMVLAWARIGEADAEKYFLYFNSEHLMEPEPWPGFQPEWESIYATAKKYVDKQRRKERRSLEKIVEKNVYLTQDDLYINIQSHSTMKPPAFNNMLAPYIESASPARQLHTYAAIDTATTDRYVPGEGVFIETETGDRFVNTWSRPEWPDTNKTPDRFIKHLNFLFPDDLQRNIVLNYMAHVIQKPGYNHAWALLIYGEEEGTGKSFIIETLAKILGKQNAMKINNQTFELTDNSWMLHELVYVNDIDQANKVDFVERLKDSITDQTVSIKRLYRPVYTADNIMNLIATTNHEDAIYFHTPGDRRWCIVETRAEPKSQKYYNDLFGLLDDKEEIGAIVNYLKTYDLTGYQAKGRPEMTDIKRRMIELSSTDMDEELSGAIEELEVKKVVTTADVLDMSRYGRKGPRAVSRSMKKLGYYMHQKRVVYGKKTAIFVHKTVPEAEKTAEIDAFLNRITEKNDENEGIFVQ